MAYAALRVYPSDFLSALRESFDMLSVQPDENRISD
jgi:hypothetical protein